MGKCWHVVFKRQIRGYDPDQASACPDHPQIGRSMKHLDLLAKAQGWILLSSFHSEDPDVAVDLLDDESEDEIVEILERMGTVKWFSADEAATTVRRLIEGIEQLPFRIPLNPKAQQKLLIELKDLAQILQLAVEKKIPIRFYSEFG